MFNCFAAFFSRRRSCCALIVACVFVTFPAASVCFAAGAASPEDGRTTDAVADGAPVAASGVIGTAKRKTIATAITVNAAALATDTNEGYERRITTQEVEESAGTFGDPSRFMQMLPGVVSDNDQRNDFIVRGGNPAETLFVIDNIQIPSINQLALADTTAGFVSMIDSAAVQHMTLHTDTYDSKFDQRMSAVMEMSTRPEGPVERHVRSEFGVGGTGGSMQRPLGADGRYGSLFVSARRSVLNLFTNDIGMNGVPIYNNGLVRADGKIDEKNNWWGLSLTGIDSMTITPSINDSQETDPFNIDYTGWRNTTGINWQHIFSAKTFGVLSVSNSDQKQTIVDYAQQWNDAQVYSERSHDGISIVKYDWTHAVGHWLMFTAGGQTSVDRMNYNVQQPLGLPNPYSADPTPGNAMAMDRVFTPFSSAGYAQAAITLPHGMKIVAGERVAQWAIVGSTVATPKVVFFAPVFGRMFHAGYAEYAQLPPSLYVLAFANQKTLTPIRSRHLTAGIGLMESRKLRITLEGYQKLYSDYPVADNYPQLTMANIADTFGKAFLMFPMTSKGLGVARGVEMATDLKAARWLTLSSALTYMRSWYSGLDGVLRKGSFDIPVVANFSGNARLSKRWTASFRYSASTGKPYTPDNMALSTSQDRDVYDLTQLNALRAPMYSRLDLRAEWTHTVKRGVLTVHVGLDNALGTSNFYSNEWMINNIAGGTLEQKQMPMFPDGGVRWSY